MPFEKILENGILKIKDNEYVKIIEVEPINFFLKTEMEQKAILNSYKIFLKTCNFDIQILIQSKKEDLNKNILNLKNQLEKENNYNLLNFQEKYIKYIKKINEEKMAASKNFYIIIKESNNVKELTNEKKEKIIIENLQEKYLKIKECLARCGNKTNEINIENLKMILFSFFNRRQSLLE